MRDVSMNWTSSYRRSALSAFAVVFFAALLAACAGDQTAPVRAVTAGTGSSPTTTTRLPPIIHRGATLPAPGRSNPVPLVVALHGKDATPAGFLGQTGFNAAADRFGFVVAYLDSPPPTWSAPSNISYIGLVITTLKTAENIDPQRVYVAGFSAGGYATYQTACQLSGTLAAIAVVSNVMTPLSRRPCDISRPVSELNIVGSNDPFLVHQTSASSLSADQTAGDWRALNGCSSHSDTTQLGPTVQTIWSDCIGGSAVGEYVVEGGVHTWPGSLRTGVDAQYSATDAIVSFFGSHPASTTRFTTR